MKVIQINSVCGFGSTGNICIDISNGLNERGHQSKIVYGQLNSDYIDSYKFGYTCENHLHNIQSRIFGLQGYGSLFGTIQLIKFLKVERPDIIHLHNLHGNYLNIDLLFKFLSKLDIPIFWTLHDCWPFTGKCAHYTDVKCQKWKVECNNCPQISSYPPSLILDRSQKMFRDKKQLFTSLKNLIIIPVSNWLADQVKNSFLGVFPIHPVYNWVNHDIFKPNSNKIKKSGNVDLQILSVSAFWKKDSNKVLDLLKLASCLPENISLKIIGLLDSGILLPKNIEHLPFIGDPNSLAKVYSNSDIYLHLSTEDTFGKVIAEAMSCGTPCIVYNSTACPEILGYEAGVVVDARNIEQILNAINLIRQNNIEYYQTKGRNRVLDLFDIKTNVGKIISMYEDSQRFQ
jgi:glycosyltransferase involved in cell wall biosynthesis